MNTTEYTLTHVSDSLEQLSNMALYLNSGAYTEEISEKLFAICMTRLLIYRRLLTS